MQEELVFFITEHEYKRYKSIVAIENIEKLCQNWNGYDADPISNIVIHNSKMAVEKLYHQPYIYPTACDSVQFEYKKINGEYLEIEIFEDKMCIFVVDENGAEREEMLYFSVEQIIKEVDNFFYNYNTS